MFVEQTIESPSKDLSHSGLISCFFFFFLMVLCDGSFHTSLRSSFPSFIILEVKSFFLRSKPVLLLPYFKPPLTFYWSTIELHTNESSPLFLNKKEKKNNNFRPSSHSVVFFYNLDTENLQRSKNVTSSFYRWKRCLQGHLWVLSWQGG